MGIEIDLCDLNICGNAEVMGNVRIGNADDLHIALKHSEIKQNAKVLNDLEIDAVLNELKQKAQVMDKNSLEYPKIKKILGIKLWNRDDFNRCVLKHIGEFSQGVLASIVASLLLK